MLDFVEIDAWATLMKEYVLMKLKNDYRNVRIKVREAIKNQCIVPQCQKFGIDVKEFMEWLDEKSFW